MEIVTRQVNKNNIEIKVIFNKSVYDLGFFSRDEAKELLGNLKFTVDEITSFLLTEY